MKTMKSYCPKPSDAIRAMVDGLREIPGEGFIVDMSEFGDIEDGVCCGCAATCAVQKAVGQLIPLDRIHSVLAHGEALGVLGDDIMAWEHAINDFRLCDLVPLGDYYDVDLPEPDEEWELETDDYLEQLPIVERYLATVVEAGL